MGADSQLCGLVLTAGVGFATVGQFSPGLLIFDRSQEDAASSLVDAGALLRAAEDQERRQRRSMKGGGLAPLDAKSEQAPEPSAPSVPDLGHILVFDDPAHCRFGTKLDAVIDQMSRHEEGEWLPGQPFVIDGYPGLAKPTYHRSEDGLVTSSLPLQGTWHGLQVSRIYREIQFHPYIEIRFLETPDHVREVLNRAGFVLPAIGERQVTSEPDDMESGQSVIPLPGGAALACYW